MSVGVGIGFLSPSICLSVCLSVCPQHNSKTNDPKVFKLGVGNNLGDTLEVVLFWGSKVQGQGHRVNNTTQQFRTTIAFHSYSLGGDTSTITLQPRFVVIRYSL